MFDYYFSKYEEVHLEPNKHSIHLNWGKYPRIRQKLSKLCHRNARSRSSQPVGWIKRNQWTDWFADETEPFFAFVPTYLDGGNGIDNGVKELMTNALGEYIAYDDNAKLCHGVVGSGNKNFNEQYCLTAKRYASQFNIPFLADYELRGTGRDVERIYKLLAQS